MSGPLRVGIDLRPALLGRTGVARVAAELYRALDRRAGLQVQPWVSSWSRPRADHGLRAPRARGFARGEDAAHGLGADRLPRVPLPGRLAHLLAPCGFGVETLLGPLDVFQHTDLVFAPVRRAREVVIVHDLAFLAGEAWHDTAFARRVAPRLRRRLARAAGVIVPSARSAAELRSSGLLPPGFAPSRLRVAPWGVDHLDLVPRPDDAERRAALLERAGLAPEAFSPEAGAGGLLLVLVPGTREPRKNQLSLLEAFAALPRDLARDDAGRPVPAALLFAGPRGWGCDELERRLASCARDPALAGRVGVAGELDEPDWSLALRSAQVVAYPSFAEGFGFPVAEALAVGRAVLTARDTPMTDLGGEAVLAVDPRDPAALRAGLAALLADPARRAALSAAGPARVAGLRWSSTAAVAQALYEDIAG